MTIYQIYETDPIDDIDYLFESYLHEKTALERLQELKIEARNELRQYRRCANCPVDLVKEGNNFFNNYCPHLNNLLNSSNGINNCDAFVAFPPGRYRIVEVEVDERRVEE